MGTLPSLLPLKFPCRHLLCCQMGSIGVSIACSLHAHQGYSTCLPKEGILPPNYIYALGRHPHCMLPSFGRTCHAWCIGRYQDVNGFCSGVHMSVVNCNRVQSNRAPPATACLKYLLEIHSAPEHVIYNRLVFVNMLTCIIDVATYNPCIFHCTHVPCWLRLQRSVPAILPEYCTMFCT